MNTTTVIILSISGMVVVPVLIWFIVWSKSFTHKVWIAKQSGKEITDVIWVEDKFKVVDKGGEHLIVLKRHKGSSPSFSGDFWTKFMKNSSIAITAETWRTSEIKKHLGRGIFLYQTTEGEFHPMSVGFDGKEKFFKVLPQDNRGFIIRTLAKSNELSLNSRKQMIIYLAVVGAIVVLGVAFVLWLIYMTESAGNLCGVAGSTFSQTAQNVVVGG